jgi:hypothetical protein
LLEAQQLRNSSKLLETQQLRNSSKLLEAQQLRKILENAFLQD